MSRQGNEEKFRDYETAKGTHVDNFYKNNHTHQTYKTASEKKLKYSQLQIGEFGVWEMLLKLNSIIDESDPDTSLSQIQHAFQAAERARNQGEPKWMQIVCLIHDLGKVLFLPPNNEPQWFVVGDTFPLGCKFSENIVFPHYFALNPDSTDPRYNTKLGVYTENCGLENVLMSYGHDEYLYQVIRPYLPEEAAFVIRFHSFYSCHSGNDYSYLLSEKDRVNMEWIKRFNSFDLYTKHDEVFDEGDVGLGDYYRGLLDEFFPDKIKW